MKNRAVATREESSPCRDFSSFMGAALPPPETTRALIARAGGPDAPILLLAQTAEDAAAKAKGSVDWLKENGARTVTAPMVQGRSDSAGLRDLLTLLEKARGVWIPGGDQNRFTELFGATAVPAAIRAVHARGGAVGGSSAGAALMSEWMPTGDDTKGKVTQDAAKLAPGLNLLPGMVVDTHFFARERTQRLVTMILSHPERGGLGIDQDGWVEVDGKTNRLTVRAGQVASIRVPSPVRRDKEGRLGAADIRVRVLLPGESVPLSDLR